MITSRYFKEQEFRNCSPGCSLQDMQQSFIDKLDKLRTACGFPLYINSAYRSKAWEKMRGRTGTGSHTLGVAVDIKCMSERDRFTIVKNAIALGFTRVGIAKTYIHLDSSTNHTQGVIWLY